VALAMVNSGNLRCQAVDGTQSSVPIPSHSPRRDNRVSPSSSTLLLRSGRTVKLALQPKEGGRFPLALVWMHEDKLRATLTTS
jgi:hypothetical protein